MAESSAVLTVVILLCGLLAGAMVFFSFAMAPLIFIKLPAEVSGPFIRQVFPVYYLSLGVVAALAGAMLLWPRPFDGGVLLAVSAAFFFSRQILMPRINRLRDAQLRNDPGSERNAFGLLHRLSVLVNYAQLAAVVLVLIRLLHY